MSNPQKPRSVFETLSEGKTPEVIGEPETAAAPVAPPVAPPLRQPNVAPAPRISAPATQAVIADQPAPPSMPVDAGVLGQLLNYLILKEGREAAAAEQNEERRKTIQRQRERNAKDQDAKILLKQARCKHLKGGRRGPKTQNKDYAVYQFRLIDFTNFIRCRICGMKWFPKDTADALVRLDKNGRERKVANHTHKGWRDALDMCDASTDTQASSESIPNIAPNATNLDAAGQTFETRLVDKETGELVEGVVI